MIILNYWQRIRYLCPHNMVKSRPSWSFFLVLYCNETWMISKLIEGVCNLFVSGYEISNITIFSRFFQVWNDIHEKSVENFWYSLIICNQFFWNYFLWTISCNFKFHLLIKVSLFCCCQIFFVVVKSSEE